MKNIFIVTLFLPTILVFSTCIEPGSFNFDEATFKMENGKWKESNICDYYFVSAERTWGPEYYFETVVKNGVKESQKIFDWANEPVLYEKSIANTISELYLSIAKTVDYRKKYCRENNIHGDYMTIEYDETYHYPKLIDGMSIGYRLEITKFEVLSE